MAATWNIRVTDTHLEVQVLGSYSGIKDAVAGLTTIVEQRRAARRWRVLLDLTVMDGIIPPRDRFLLGTQAAQIWGQRVRAALLAPPDQITHFFENVAANNGAAVQVFADRDAALAWLETGRLAG